MGQSQTQKYEMLNSPEKLKLSVETVDGDSKLSSLSFSHHESPKIPF